MIKHFLIQFTIVTLRLYKFYSTAWEFTVKWSWVNYAVIMHVGDVSLDFALIMHEQAFGDYLTDQLFFSLWKVWAGEQASVFNEENK